MEVSRETNRRNSGASNSCDSEENHSSSQSRAKYSLKKELHVDCIADFWKGARASTKQNDNGDNEALTEGRIVSLRRDRQLKPYEKYDDSKDNSLVRLLPKMKSNFKLIAPKLRDMKNLHRIKQFSGGKSIDVSNNKTNDRSLRQITNESLRDIADDYVLWTDVRIHLKTNKVVTNACAREVIQSYIIERQARLENICKDRLRSRFSKELAEYNISGSESRRSSLCSESRRSSLCSDGRRSSLCTDSRRSSLCLGDKSLEATDTHNVEKSIMPRRCSLVGTNIVKPEDLYSLPPQPTVPIIPPVCAADAVGTIYECLDDNSQDHSSSIDVSNSIRNETNDDEDVEDDSHDYNTDYDDDADSCMTVHSRGSSYAPGNQPPIPRRSSVESLLLNFEQQYDSDIDVDEHSPFSDDEEDDDEDGDDLLVSFPSLPRQNSSRRINPINARSA